MNSSSIICIVLGMALCLNAVSAQPLFDYVNKPDSNYNWTDTGVSWKGAGYTGYVINMTSQQWLTPEEVSRSIWWHYMTIMVPDKLNAEYQSNALLWVTGGKNSQGMPNAKTMETPVMSIVCVELGMIGVILYDIPNQPIVFAADPLQKSRTEDDLMAMGWTLFLNDTSRPEYVPNLPMVKATIRAMDAAQDYVSSTQNVTLEKFMISGASKRGWTTWLTGAMMDSRVIGIAPIVMDELNFNKNIHHHFRAYGGWSFAFEPYWKLNFTLQLDTPQMVQLMDILDPIAYNDNLSQVPRLLISASGDEFFVNDDSRYWSGDMRGDWHQRIMPNCEHTIILCIPEVAEVLTAYTFSLVTQSARPTFNWTISDVDGTITVNTLTGGAPSSVKLWQATTSDGIRRDFRLVRICQGTNCILGNGKPGPNLVFWKSTNVTVSADGTYTAVLPPPAVGWTGFYLELDYPAPFNTVLKYTTDVSIVPNTFPFPDCSGEECLGTLV